MVLRQRPSWRRRAKKAAIEVAKIGKLTVREGNSGDDAINDWIAAMMSLYRRITGKEPATSVGAPKRPNEGIAAGPLIRFLEAAGQAAKDRIFRGCLAQPGAHDPEGRFRVKLRTIWPFRRLAADPPYSGRYARRQLNIH